MRLRFDYPGPEGEPFRIPQEACIGVFEPRARPVRDAEPLLRQALARPAAGPSVRELASGAEDVLVLVDDATRATPTGAVLARLAEELALAGVPDRRVTLLVAPGTQRRMTHRELHAKIGEAFLARWRVEQHDHAAMERLHGFGTTDEGMPVVANRLVAEADLVLGIGSVRPHPLMGYSGGAKILFPGAAGAASIAWTMWRALDHPLERLMGVPENPLRRSIESAASVAGLDAVVNVVLDARGRVAAAASGGPVAAHRAMARAAAEVSARPLPEPADVVVLDAAGADRDVWQSARALWAADLAARDGGCIVLVAPHPAGVDHGHPALAELAGATIDEIRRLVEDAEVDDVPAAAVAALLVRTRARLSRVFVVSSGLAPADARALGMEPVAGVDAAVDEALHEAGPGARVAVLRGGGMVLPVVPGRNMHLVASTPR